MTSPKEQRPTMRYNPPPTWPAPPQGWEPTPGWQPDPAWGPAPAGWQVWLEPAPAAPAAPSPAEESARAPATTARAWLAGAVGGFAGLLLATAVERLLLTGAEAAVGVPFGQLGALGVVAAALVGGVVGALVGARCSAPGLDLRAAAPGLWTLGAVGVVAVVAIGAAIALTAMAAGVVSA